MARVARPQPSSDQFGLRKVLADQCRTSLKRSGNSRPAGIPGQVFINPAARRLAALDAGLAVTVPWYWLPREAGQDPYPHRSYIVTSTGEILPSRFSKE